MITGHIHTVCISRNTKLKDEYTLLDTVTPDIRIVLYTYCIIYVTAHRQHHKCLQSNLRNKSARVNQVRI